MNGTGASNEAADTSTELGALGYHMVGIGDTTPVGDVAETYVYYGSRDAATEAAAESVSRSMSGSVTMAYDPSKVADGADVTVVTGTQFAVNTPAPSQAASGSVVASTAPPAPSTTTPSDAIAAPTPTTSNLQPWDPRACAPGAVPTAPVPNPT